MVGMGQPSAEVIADEARLRPVPSEESALIERARQGDTDAFADLMRSYQDVAFRLAWQVTGDADEAADAAQDGFIRAHRALDTFRAGAPFRPWLLKIVLNEARARLRSRRRRASLRERIGFLPRYPEPDPFELVATQDDNRWLLAALARLSLKERNIIAFRYLLDLNEAELAAIFDCPRGTVKSRLSRAMARLRRVVADSGAER
jgi:RNA polymerase sigma-70 factor (ECF subfamily)